MNEVYLCRLCLAEADPLLLVHSKVGIELNIYNILSNYLWFKIEDDDEISNKICTVCWNKFEEFYKFVEDIRQKQDNITMIIQNLNTKAKIEVVEYVDSQDDAYSDKYGDIKEETEEDYEQNSAMKTRSKNIKLNISVNRKSSEKCKNSDSNKTGKKGLLKKNILEAEFEKEESLIESYFKLKCDFCFENLKSFKDVKEHYPNAHNIRGYIMCCGKKFFKRSIIAEHVLYHTEPETFKCSECDDQTVYDTKNKLNNHTMLVHAPSDMILYKCDTCDKIWPTQKSLDRHKLLHLSLEEKNYTCPDCGKLYATAASLKAHKRIVHQKSYDHVCEICGRNFKSRVFFEKHQLEHVGKYLPKVQCMVCNLWLKNEHTLRSHKRLHRESGIEHKCDICGKISPSHRAKQKHIRYVHFTERKFSCTLCNKAFKVAVTLKEHMTTHTGEILYSCAFCSKKFNSKANMHAHRKRIHPIEWAKERMAKLKSLEPEEEML